MEEHDLIIRTIEEGRKEEASAIVEKHIYNQEVTVSDVIREKKE